MSNLHSGFFYLGFWFLISIPAALFIGKFIARGMGTDDEKQ